MKKSLADCIAEYIKVLIVRSGNRQIEIQRAELAETFACVPSQITYVISTRFREEDGYITESRRGSQGYVRITQVKNMDAVNAGQSLPEFLDEMLKQGLLNHREMEMLKYVVFMTVVDLPPEYRSRAEQKIMKNLYHYLIALNR